MCIVAMKKPYTLILRHDSYASSPREEDCFGKMICFHPHYNLGDKHDYSDPEEFLSDLVREKYVRAQEIIDYVRSGQSKTVKLEYNHSARWWNGCSYNQYTKNWSTECSFDPPLVDQKDFIADSLIDVMPLQDLMRITQKHYCILPIYLYDHSGLTINTTGFSCPWDSSQVGWIYASHVEISNEYNTLFTDRLAEKAIVRLKGEVESYDHYLRGDCYRYTLYQDNEEIDSCGGFIGPPDELQEAIESYLPDEAKGMMDNLTYRHDEPDIEDILQEQEDELEVG